MKTVFPKSSIPVESESRILIINILSASTKHDKYAKPMHTFQLQIREVGLFLRINKPTMTMNLLLKKKE